METSGVTRVAVSWSAGLPWVTFITFIEILPVEGEAERLLSLSLSPAASHQLASLNILCTKKICP